MPTALQKYLGSRQDQAVLVGPFFSGSESDFTGDPQKAIVFVDRGARFRPPGATIGFAVGDGDSYDGPLDEYLDPRKDFSDLAYVFRHLDGRFRDIKLRGFLGGRRDHELMNLSEAHTFLHGRENATEVHFDNALRAFSAGSWVLRVQGVFSLFAFAPVRLSCTGACVYQVQETEVFRPLSSHGLSNQGSGQINLICDGPVFIFTN